MIEPRWEVRIGSMVSATDGDCGHLQQLLVDPHQGRVVALLVRPHRLTPSQAVIVPKQAIADASEKEVRLNINREQVDTLPKYWGNSEVVVEAQKYEANDELFAVRGKQIFEVGRAPTSREAGMIENQLSGSEGKHLGLRLRAGQQVFCRNEHAGWVSLILLDSNGQVKGFVLHTGHLHLTGRELIVPAAWIQEADRRNVHLSAAKQELENLPDYYSDEVLGAAVDNVLWFDEILRNTDYNKIEVSVEDGIVRLRGYLVTARNKRNAEEAARSVPGVLNVENELVVDDDLVLEVAQALGKNEVTRSERIAVGAQNGFITLNGCVASPVIRDDAEAITAGIPRVRGVINYLHAPNVIIDYEDEPIWQPHIGQEVHATDMRLGQVARVIISPRNRRVTSFVARGYFPGPQNKDGYRLPSDEPQEERHVVIPIDVVRSVTNSSVLLEIGGIEAARYPSFQRTDFISPPPGWQPPYPYRCDQVLFEKHGLEESRNANTSI